MESRMSVFRKRRYEKWKYIFLKGKSMILSSKVKITQSATHGLSLGILQARILEWVAFPFSRGSSQPRDWTQVSRIAGVFFTCWVTREALFLNFGFFPSAGYFGTERISNKVCLKKVAESLWKGNTERRILYVVKVFYGWIKFNYRNGLY